VVSADQLATDADNSQAVGETMSTFAGLYVSGSLIHVGVTQDTPAIESQLENGADPSEYVFAVEHTSWKTLLRMQQALMNRASAAGLNVSEAWPDPKTDRLGVGLVTLPANAEATVASLVGSDAVSVAQMSVPHTYLETDTRSHDASPWNGGDYLSLTKTSSTCTTGPPVTGNQTGDDYVLTAGHCFSVGDIVHNYDAYSSVGGYGTIGEINIGNYNNENDGDVKLILTTGYGGSSDLDYFGTGGPGDSTSTTVTAGQDPSVGTDVCGDGAFDGRLCGGVVQKILVCKQYSDGTTHCGEDEETSSGTYTAGQGDSGGPITGPVGHTAFGTITAGEAPTYECNVENPAQTRYCFGTQWFESMGYIERFYGVTVK
jgi:hypothetical protein